MRLVDHEAHDVASAARAAHDVVIERLRRGEEHAARAPQCRARRRILLARNLSGDLGVEPDNLQHGARLLRHQRLGWRQKHDLALGKPPEVVQHDDGCNKRLAHARR
jgi:hypothetical protein